MNLCIILSELKMCSSANFILLQKKKKIRARGAWNVLQPARAYLESRDLELSNAKDVAPSFSVRSRSSLSSCDPA